MCGMSHWQVDENIGSYEAQPMASKSYKSMYIDSQKKVFCLSKIYFSNASFKHVHSVFGLGIPFFIMFFIALHMQLEALTDENRQLNGKLEIALGKIEVVCWVIIIILVLLHLDCYYCKMCYYQS